MRKLNVSTEWYPYKEFGCWYKLESGKLMYAPMRINGSIDRDENGKINYAEVEVFEDSGMGKLEDFLVDLVCRDRVTKATRQLFWSLDGVFEIDTDNFALRDKLRFERLKDDLAEVYVSYVMQN